MIVEKQTKTATNQFSDDITFKFMPLLKTFEKDGKKYCRLTASSNGEDLVGDIMSLNALRQMEKAAVGMLMFMNHKTSVPEDVFGAVVEAELKEEQVDLVGGGKGKLQVLHYLVEVEETNDRAVKCWQMIDSGKKLGASVTVLVKDKSPNPKRNKGIIIEDVEYLETSIVGMPCNRQSWAYKASKALELAEKRSSKNEAEGAEETAAAPQIQNNGEVKTVMADENKTAAVTPEDAGGNESAETATLNKYFSRTLKAIEDYQSVRAQITAKAENITLPEGDLSKIVQKGMFNDILAQAPTFWDLCDILCSVRWKLIYQVDNLKYVGGTDFSAIQTAWQEALDEFKAAQIDSFNYWQKIDVALVEDDDDMLSNALAVEKSFETLQEVFAKSSGEEVQTEIRSAAEKIYSLAKQFGLVADVQDSELIKEAQIPVAVTNEEIEKSQKFIDVKKELETANTEKARLEKELGEMTANFETAKAGLKAANATIGSVLRQPMQTAAEETPATS